MRFILISAVMLGVACGRSELPGELVLRSQADAIPTTLPTDCSAPTAPEKPRLEVSKQVWSRGCIAVRYTDDMAQHVPQLQAALASWAAPCSWLCFEPARLWTSGDADRPGLLMLGDRGVTRSTDLPLMPEFSFKGSPVARWSQQVGLRQRAGAELTRADFVRAVGMALGFQARAGVESSLDGTHSEPTEADLQSACAVYPRCQ